MKLLKNYYKILFILIMMFVINNNIVKASSSDYAIFNSGEVTIYNYSSSTVSVYFKANKNIDVDALEAYFDPSDSTSNITLSNLQTSFNSGQIDSDINNGLIYMLDTNGYSFNNSTNIFVATYTVDKNTLSGTYELNLTVKSVVESGSLEEESFTLTTNITVTRQTEPYSASFTKDSGVQSVDLYYTDDLENVSESNALIGYARDENGDLDLSGHGIVSFKVNLKNGYELDEITCSPDSAYESISDYKNIFKLNTYSVNDISGNVTINIKTKVRTKYNIYFIKDKNIDSIDIYYDEDFNSKSNASVSSITEQTGEVDLSGNGKVYLAINPKHGYIVNYPSIYGEHNSLNKVDSDINYLYRIDGINGDLIVGVTSTKRTEINPNISGYNSSYTYTGNEIKPNIVVSINNSVLTKGVDYNVSYSNNKNAGNNTAKITITSIDTSSYIFDDKTVSFSINPIEITKNNITVPSYIVHNGNALTVTPSVSVNGKTLVNNTDYTVSYENQNGNVGEYLIVNVNGKNNYTGNNRIQVLIESKYNVGNLLTPSISITKGNNNSLVLNWDSQELAEEYLILRSVNNKNFSQINSVKTNSYTDKSLTYGTTYYYKVKAKNRAKISNESNLVSMKVIPNNVNGFKSTTVTKNSIKLVWDKVSGSGYQLQRSTDNKKWTTIKTFTSNTNVTYTNTGLNTNKLYYYRIRSFKTINKNKVYGNFITIKMKTSPLSPKVSVSLRDFNSLNVKVSSVSGASKYIIYSSTSKTGKYSKVGELNSASTYSDLNLITGKTYYYKVKACNSYNKCSTYSSIVSKKVTPKVPSVTVNSTEKKIVNITVSKVTGATGYDIYRSTSKTGNYKKIKTMTSNLSFNDNTLSNKTYYYKVRSYRLVNNKNIYSNFSSIKTIKSK